MISGISHITRYVQDAEAALKFYTEVLGFQKCADGEVGPGMRWLTVTAPEQKDLEVVLFEPRVWFRNPEEAARAEAILSQQPSLIFRTRDIEAAFEKLKSAGVELLTPEIRDLPWGRDLEIRDITGSVVSLVEAKPEFAF